MAGELGRRLRRGWPWLVGALLVLVLLAQALRPAVHEVETIEVRAQPMRVTLDEEGETRWRDTFVLTAPVAGTVSRIVLEPGDPVRAGDEVATLQPASPALLDARTREQLRAEVAAAQAALGGARAEAAAADAQARQAAADLKRMRPLTGVGALAEAELEALELAARTAEERRAAAAFAVRVATHRLEAAEAALRVEAGAAVGGGGGAGERGGGRQGARTGPVLSLRAPVDGVVWRRHRVSAGVVGAGEPLLEIGDPTTLEVVADYLSTDAVQLRPGMQVVVDGWGGGDDALPGIIRRIEPAGFTKVSALGVEEQRVNVIVAPAGGDDAVWAALGAGYRVQTRAVTWEADEVLAVPVGCLFREGERWAVFVVEDGRAVKRVVEVGHRTATHVEITDGLSAGEIVIVHPGDQIEDGVGVRSRGR